MKSTKRRPTAAPVARQTAATPAWTWSVILLGLVVLIYWPTLANGFVSDDSWFVAGLAKLSSLSGLRDIWFKPGTVPQYNPLAQSVLWIEYQFCGLNPQMYHALNIALHAGVVLLLWRLLERLDVAGAWLAAALFAVHPVQVETVAWVSEIKNLLSAILVLLSLLAYLRFSPPKGALGAAQDALPASGRRLDYALSLVLYLGAVLSKTATVTLPAVLLVIYWWKRGRLEWREAARLAPFFIVGLGFASVTVWLERSVVGAMGPEWDFSLIDRVLIAGRDLWFYVGELAWPYPLTITYPRWQIDAGDWRQYLFPAAAAAVVIALWATRNRIGRGPLAAVLIFGGVLSPTLGFFDVYWFLYSFVADHFQYHACMALLALAAAAAVRVAGAFSAEGYRVATVAAAALLLLLAALAHYKTYAYKDNETLIRDNVALNPNAWAGHNNLGDWLRDHNQHSEALDQYREALRLFPKRNPLRQNIGVELLALGRLQEAESEFQQALDSAADDEQRYSAHSSLVQIMKATGRPVEARVHVAAAMQAAVRIAPANAQVREDAGATFLMLGRLAEAEENLRQAIALNPQAAGAHSAFGELLARQGDRDGAIREFEAALVIDPKRIDAAENLRQLQSAEPAPSPRGRAIEVKQNPNGERVD